MARGFERPPGWANVVIVAGVVVAAALFLVDKNRTPPVDDGGASAAEVPATTSPAAPTLQLPAAGASVLFFGDSYTEGYGAQPETNGYAYLVATDFGWTATIDAVSGTGYLNPGPAGSTYVQRGAALPDITPALVVLQGGLNDQDVSPGRPAVNAAATQVVEAIRAKYPDAQVVLLGPVAPTGTPSRELIIVDDALHRVAIDEQLPWISPVEERWDVSGHLIADKTHPDNEGYSYLAAQVAQDLRVLAGG